MYTRNDRAEQFQAFDGVAGLREALAEKEEQADRTARRQLSEEASDQLNRTLARIRPGDPVRVRCYCLFHEVTVTGWVNAVDAAGRRLTVDGREIRFEDIYEIGRL